MGPVLIIVAILVVLGIVIYLGKLAAARNRQRLAALSSWANANGFQFSQTDPFNLDARFNGIADIGHGHARYAFEVVSRKEPAPTWMFRYQYRTWETRTVTHDDRTETETYEETHWANYLIVELQAAFPKFDLRPEGFFDKVAGFAGFGDINFESEEFSKQYYCKSDNREFAYALIHPQMIEWMLSLRTSGLQFQGQLVNGLFVSDLARLPITAQGRQSALALASGFINRIPSFVWQDYGKRAPVQIPEPVPYAEPVLSGEQGGPR